MLSQESDIDEDEELPKTTLAQVLDNLQVVRKYIQEQPEIGDEFFSALNVIENFTDRSKNKKQLEISLKNSFTLIIIFSL
jgi:hypothetical protein